MIRLKFSMCSPVRVVARLLVALAVTCIINAMTWAAALPVAPQTFDTTYAAPTGTTLTVAAGGNLQAALDQAQLGDTIVLEAGATFTGPFQLPRRYGRQRLDLRGLE